MSESSLRDTAYAGRPSVCRSCGALVGAGETACGQCGATLASSTGQPSTRRLIYDREALRFARAILARPATFTIIFIVANIFIFLLAVLTAGGESSPSFNAILIAYGAKVNSLIDQNGAWWRGEWWRFVTPIFLHGGIVHLLFNMYGLWMLGPYVERLYGSAKFVVFWVVTGVAGVVASYLTVRPEMHVNSLGRFLFKAEDVPSVGASGALFGLIGVLFVFGIKFRRELPEGFKRAFGTGMLPIILINFFIGFLGRGFIDNAAHVGGLVAGASLALLVGYKRPGQRAGVAICWHVLQIAALMLVVLCFAKVAFNYNGPAPSLENASVENLLPGDSSTKAKSYLQAIKDGTDAFELAVGNGDTSKIESAIDGLNNAPHLDDRTDQMREEFVSLLVRARALAQMKPEERKQPRARQQNNKLFEDYQAWSQNFREWAKTDGEKYGFRVDEPAPAQSAPQKK